MGKEKAMVIRQAGGEEEREMDVERTMNMLEAVENDANAVASSFTSLLSSVQSALSQVTCTSVEHMNCHCDAAGHLQDAAINAASKGNRFINSCLRLNEEMKGLESLAAQLKLLRQTVDQLENQANRMLLR
ncbi:hypothetical protein O6H91_12G032700 [Diphasiastrum complanatum]|uniref:Uncharacterized protein n=1 Tax=Diphasiastrum complanatum TaxID=34168 RepID=A0ACC2C069_DIPCM|nr:hypothetical protein O6H91_12G032700 [Diphasiastrum complanatum]